MSLYDAFQCVEILVDSAIGLAASNLNQSKCGLIIASVCHGVCVTLSTDLVKKMETKHLDLDHQTFWTYFFITRWQYSLLFNVMIREQYKMEVHVPRSLADIWRQLLKRLRQWIDVVWLSSDGKL